MKKINLSVKLLDIKMLDLIASFDVVSRIYLEADSYILNKPDISSIDKEIYISLPDVFTTKGASLIDSNYDFLAENSDGFLIHNLDELFYLKERGFDLEKVISSERLYAYNTEAVDFYKGFGLHNLTHPIELTFSEGYDISFESVEEIIYGRYGLMVSSGCVHKNTAKCDQKQQNLILKDRKKMAFFVQNRCDYCYNVTYNSVPTMILDELDRIHQDAKSVRIDFTFESKDEIGKIIKLYEACLNGNCPAKEEFGEYTRGHYHKGMVS